MFLMSDTKQEAIVITDAAAAKIDELAIKANSLPNLRIALRGGGCSGFLYDFNFEDKPNKEDSVFVKNGIAVLIDPISLQYLQGSNIDYEDGIMESRFVIKNPHFTRTCGCGQSIGM
jgi:iron-sulfur cluster insertion protein